MRKQIETLPTMKIRPMDNDKVGCLISLQTLPKKVKRGKALIAKNALRKIEREKRIDYTHESHIYRQRRRIPEEWQKYTLLFARGLYGVWVSYGNREVCELDGVWCLFWQFGVWQASIVRLRQIDADRCRVVVYEEVPKVLPE